MKIWGNRRNLQHSIGNASGLGGYGESLLLPGPGHPMGQFLVMVLASASLPRPVPGRLLGRAVWQQPVALGPVCTAHFCQPHLPVLPHWIWLHSPWQTHGAPLPFFLHLRSRARLTVGWICPCLRLASYLGLNISTCTPPLVLLKLCGSWHSHSPGDPAGLLRAWGATVTLGPPCEQQPKSNRMEPQREVLGMDLWDTQE